MLRRILLGFGANAFSQGVSIAIQLFSLPLFLLYWDSSTYGTWLLLSAIPAYVNMADVGMVTTAGNKMAMAVGRSDLAEANNVYQSAQLFMAIVCCALAVILTPVALFGPLPDFMTTDMRVALAAMLCGVLIALYGGLSEAVFRATGRYAVGTMLGQLVRLAEWGGAMVGLILFRSFSGVALCSLFARAVGAGIGIVLAQRGGQGLLLGFRHASTDELKSMARPAISFMAFPLANALSFQGVTLLVGVIAGASAVAVFNTYRTIARVAVQVTSMFSHALGPEFSRLFGNGDMATLEAVFRRSAALSAAQSVAVSVVLYFVSPWLLRVWTHGRIEFDPSLMGWLLLYAAVGGMWHAPRVLLQATNQHVGIAGWSLVAGVLSVALAWAFGYFWQVDGVGAAMFVSEAFIAAICIYIAADLFAQSKTEVKVRPTLGE
ncbi:polysaccharide biosynthesis protein [Methylocella silvestris BL2]|uniref:Polysaccharide biosynthesis protein n=1 Tax=Methylocella silvestris (strain DSM 15510 / CIP 108128 / LMG 27833 / NCIMB 13906 / BL2) TaxID=395965 RepID=B8EQ43_METSB|nr:lipopolysaccharide biosynthesis protein [Methylocella silvestris]ACK51533.1 polysaccharide biosynthesis protein [Methylocella silvestris BL2]